MLQSTNLTSFLAASNIMLTSEYASTWLSPEQYPILDEGRPELLGWLVSEQLQHNVH